MHTCRFAILLMYVSYSCTTESQLMQELRASEVEDAELQQAIAMSLQDTKHGSLL